MRPFLSTTSAAYFAACALSAILASTGCGDGSGGSGGGGGSTNTGTPGGPVDGAADAHCAAAVTVDPDMCMPMGGTGGTGGSGGMGGMGGMMHEHNEVLYNAEGDDDDCKYHVKWSSTDVFQNQDVTFTIDLSTKADGKPATGAAPDIEAFLDETHPAPNTDQKPTEKGNGTYEVGPVQFDKPGKWTVRFHFYEDCMDSETSPHGHVGFYVNVP